MHVSLAFLFKWDYWQVEALPLDYIEELFARVGAENDIANSGKKEQAQQNTIEKMRAANRATLKKMGMKAT